MLQSLCHQPCRFRMLVPGLVVVPCLIFSVRRDEAKSPAGSGGWWLPVKTFSEVFATMPGPLFRRAHGSVRVLMQTREHLFAVMASRSSSVTSGCAMDVALGSYRKKEVNERSAPPVPFLRVDSRWISNWHPERKSSRTQQSEI